MAIEIEIKLAISDAAILLFMQYPLLQQAVKGAPQQLISTYFDTPDYQLRQHGFALRIRQQGGRYIQTLKGPAPAAAGIAAKQEWEWDVDTLAVNLDLITVTALQNLLHDVTFKQQLQPLFTTEFTRVTWDLHFQQRTLIEVALDQGSIIAGNKSLPLQEVELELKQGEANDLNILAAELIDKLHLQIDTRSKAARGFMLLEK
jgi:inorganic triphosphatase YgiF